MGLFGKLGYENKLFDFGLPEILGLNCAGLAFEGRLDSGFGFVVAVDVEITVFVFELG
jgi:hypothetical protein